MPSPTVTEIVVNATADRVFAELSDGWSYVGWVVGATHIRDVDADWPAPGSCIHHRIGGWPVTLADETVSIECVPGARLVLKAKGWPLGEAQVQLDLIELDPGRTRVEMRETPTAGPGSWVDNPALRWALRRRNIESLRRLRDRVEHRELNGR
jgi:hypothetical protein